jgi:hypothetical protein
MIKHKWLIAGMIAALILAMAAVLVIPAQSRSKDCAEDGSCCTDANACACE